MEPHPIGSPYSNAARRTFQNEIRHDILQEFIYMVDGIDDDNEESNIIGEEVTGNNPSYWRLTPHPTNLTRSRLRCRRSVYTFYFVIHRVVLHRLCVGY